MITRIAITVVAFTAGIAEGNPLPLAIPAADRMFMASEHLTATISPEVAEMHGTFTFRYRKDVSSSGQKSFVQLQVPIWFPETQPRDPSVAGFWKVFRRDDGNQITPQTRAAFENAVGLRVALGGQEVPVEEFWTLTSTNNRVRWAPPEWQREPGFSCLVFRFYFQDDSELTKKPLTISYRQPLLQTNGVGRFFYLPVFHNLPDTLSTADTNVYSITVVAKGCFLTVISGDKQAGVQAGRGIMISPRHHQPIRATAKSTPNEQK